MYNYELHMFPHLCPDFLITVNSALRRRAKGTVHMKLQKKEGKPDLRKER